MGVLAFDFETWLIAPGRLAPRPVVLSVADAAGSRLHSRSDAGAVLRTALLDGCTLVGANTAFDLGVAVQEWPDLLPLVVRAYDEGRVVDVLIEEQLQCAARGWLRYDQRTGRKPSFSLAYVAGTRLGVEVTGKTGADAWRFRYHELDGVPLAEWPEGARAYALSDAELTLAVHQHQGLSPTHHDQCRAAWALHLMSAWGVRTDPGAVESYTAALEARLTAAKRELMGYGFIRHDGSENQKAIRAAVVAAYEELGQPVPLTPTGQASISADTLRQSHDPRLDALAEISEDQTETAQWVPVLRRGTRYPINPRYNVLVASDRTSCSKPNMQNPPRREGVRDCFVPRAGHVLVSVDWNAAELRALAQLCLDRFGVSALAEAFREGKDPHLMMAANILGVEYGPAAKPARQLAKVPNFGFPGGLGAESFVAYARGQGVDLTPEWARGLPAAERLAAAIEEAQQLKATWLRTWPEMRAYFDWVNDLVGNGRATYVLERTGYVRGDVGYTDGCNHGFQSLVAHAAKRALWLVSREAYAERGAPLYGFRPTLFVHDEIIGESPEHLADQHARRLAEVMVAALQYYCPDVPIEAEPTLMRRWQKGAKPVYDASGRLIPWEG